MIIGIGRVPIRRRDVLLVDDGRDSMLLTTDGSTSYLLNPTARAIWELCDGSTHPREMVAAICDVFEVSHGVATADVGAALDQLTEVGLVRWDDPRGGRE